MFIFSLLDELAFLFAGPVCLGGVRDVSTQRDVTWGSTSWSLPACLTLSLFVTHTRSPYTVHALLPAFLLPSLAPPLRQTMEEGREREGNEGKANQREGRTREGVGVEGKGR